MKISKEEYYRGVRMAPYDLIKEALIGFGVILVLVIVFAAIFSSPDESPVTIRDAAQNSPVAFLQTMLGDLDGSGAIASYGPPYNNGSGSTQSLGPFSPEQIVGVHIPVDTAHDFVIAPLQQLEQNDPAVAQALATFQAASSDQQAKWESAYGDALQKATTQGSTVTVPPGDYGPLGTMFTALLAMGRTGGLDAFLVSSKQFYQTDYTKPLLFIQETDLIAQRAQDLHLLPTQWGMMNETGSYPGQAWLWLYTFWYQVPPYSTSPNGDLLVWLTMGVLTLLLILVPYIPGLNRAPRYLGVHKLIWRDYYRERRAALRGSASQRKESVG